MVFKNAKKVLTAMKYVALASSVVLLALAAVLGFYSYSREPYVVEEVVLARADAVSDFNITFNLVPNDIYGTTLTYAGKSLPVYLAILRDIPINYTFKLSQGSASGSYSLRIKLVHPDGWTKELFMLSGQFSEESSISLSANLNVSEIQLFMENLTKRIGVKQSYYEVAVDAELGYLATLEAGTKGGSVTHTIILRVDLARGLVTVKGEPRISEAITITSRRTTSTKLAGIPLETMRTATPLMGVAGTALLFTYVVAQTKKLEEDEVLRFEKKYKDIIIEGERLPDLSSSDVVVLKSQEEVVKVARILEKPVVKVAKDPNKVIYYVLDRKTVYVVEV